MILSLAQHVTTRLGHANDAGNGLVLMIIGVIVLYALLKGDKKR